MIEFLCKLWPYLAGGLIGWLLAGWFARRLKHSEPPIEKIVEKKVDNPQHLALISKLESENKEISKLKTKLSGYESASLKTVDNPAHLKRIAELEEQVSSLESNINKNPQTAESANPNSVDNSLHLKRISELEAELNTLKNSSTNAPLTAMDNTNAVDNSSHVNRIKELEAQVSNLQKGPDIDLAAAIAAGFNLSDENDLTVVEGIGPKIKELINADGIKSFRELADTPVKNIQTILDNAGPRYKVANPGTWPEQANLAANNHWPALKALQDVLIGGVYSNAKNNPVKTADVTPPSPDSLNTDIPELAEKTSDSPFNKSSAQAHGFNINSTDGRDDFTVIEGIGPKINDLLHNADIHTYAELSRTLVETIQQILNDAGLSFANAKPGTWPAQADFAANNKWQALKDWQDVLDGGV